MRFVRAHDGSASEAGWLELDVKAMDLEAVSRIYIDLAEVDRLRQLGDQREDAFRKARDLLGG
jgi:hypothetical protein